MDTFQLALNKEIHNLLVVSKNGTLHGRTCIICDGLIKYNDWHLVSLATFVKYVPYLRGNPQVPPSIRRFYAFSAGNARANILLKPALLSPRSQIVYKTNSNKAKEHVMCCAECKSGLNMKCLKDGKLPRFAIANGWTIGDAPECLKCLNEIELALISKARLRGHLFTYWGGCHRSIKGWHTFFDTNPYYTAAVLNNVSTLTSSDDIGVVLCGPFTPQQKDQVLRKIQVNIPRTLAAFEWLKQNNLQYTNEPTPTLRTPVIIDQSETVQSENTDIELQEQLTVIFPDGTVNTGGQNNMDDMEKAIAELRAKAPNVTPYLSSRPTNKILRDYEDDNLMKAFPLQFPYGVGLPSDIMADRSSHAATLSHLLYLSIPSFHESCFVLVVHNMWEKGRALNGAVWRIMGTQDPCNVTEEELNAAIVRHKAKLPLGHGPGDQFLKSIHAVKKNLAHSNEAAMTARAQFLSLNHHFSSPMALFTVNFEDGYDIRIAS
jgi:hypothetical protein